MTLELTLIFVRDVGELNKGLEMGKLPIVKADPELKKRIDKEFGDSNKVNEIIDNLDKRELEDKERIELGEAYELILKVLRKYCDLDEKYYSLVAVWIIGTYIHNNFPTYPYLFFNAMKGSGKSRILRLITVLGKDGCMLNSLTEAVLFRTTGTLGIDEFEGINRKGKENLGELLNSAYKKGITVKRMRKVKNIDGENQEVEEFEVYRPIVLANISGMDSVLNDRCITIILNKSSNPLITKMMEMYDNDVDVKSLLHLLHCVTTHKRCSSVVVENMYTNWNIYIHNYYTLTSNQLTTLTTLEEKELKFFNKLNKSGIDGRNLEITMSLLIIANSLNDDVLNDLLGTFHEVIEEKKKDDVVENLDVSLLDFISQELETEKWISIKELFQNFKNSIRMEEPWFNEKWMSRALKRLGLFKEKKRMSYGVVAKLNYKKAQDKIRMFK